MVRIAQVGTRGFGRIHLQRIDRLAQLGRCELVATADPAGPLPDRDVPWYPDLTALLADQSVDVVSIATPIGTHMALATQALQAGADVMLEKPPVASLADLWLLLRTIKETGRVVQIGFQSLGGGGIARMRELAVTELGAITSVQVWGQWLRDTAYFTRAAWAGRRTMNGARIADGVCTNPLAHSIATACEIVGLTDLADIVRIETELYHANAIQADDTSWVKIVRDGGVPIDICLTLDAPEQFEPTVTLVGEHGRATLEYTLDVITVEAGGRTWTEQLGRTDLLENLLDHRENPWTVPLLVPAAATVGFMATLEATQDRPDPVQIPAEYIAWEGDDSFRHAVVDDIVAWQRRCLDSGLGFAAAGAPWADESAIAVWTPTTDLTTLTIGETVVSGYSDGSDIGGLSSPRPYLHPIRTLGGVRVSDAHPADHDWHCGLSLTMQDVNGVNFWGGRTYVDGEGYQWLGDQGRIDHVEWLETGDDHVVERLRWTGPADLPTRNPAIADVIVDEVRSLRWRAVSGTLWRLDVTIDLTGVQPERITLGGPGTNGRTDAGYGGFQLRLPRTSAYTVWSPTASGVPAVFGRPAAWIAWSADFPHGRASVVMANRSQDGADDPWFVREGEWQGIGTALAWSRELPLPVHREYTLLVGDGDLTTPEIEAALA